MEDLATGIVWSLYPPLDIVILTLAAQLGRRLGRVTPPLVWFMSAMAVWLVVDTAYAVVETTAQQAYDIPVLEAAYLLAHFALAVAFVHPRLRELSPAPRRIAPRFTGDRSTMILLTVFPVILSSAVPDVDAWDTMVRTLMITVLVSLVFWRCPPRSPRSPGQRPTATTAPPTTCSPGCSTGPPCSTRSRTG
ncbi:hypothetical protein [Mobilicoccus caccae]|uniref:Uncharacterized protein n=1 Tax=Mobilicoccus caccae TaxID=1859295 RepID=A0ABQ6IP56_9MICO|nr:hypothetical protein [Mobilicoccus caccae]GMA39105.1 hypothetical protein GCM10025883_11500 [Mobilicoccus caccae]